MRYAIPVFLFLAFCLGGAQAQAKSCSSFVVLKSYDAAAKILTVKHSNGKSVARLNPSSLSIADRTENNGNANQYRTNYTNE